MMTYLKNAGLGFLVVWMVVLTLGLSAVDREGVEQYRRIGGLEINIGNESRSRESSFETLNLGLSHTERKLQDRVDRLESNSASREAHVRLLRQLQTVVDVELKAAAIEEDAAVRALTSDIK